MSAADSRPDAAPPADERIHRALASPVRRALLDALRHRPDGADVAALAAEADLHVNTVRAHLTVLEDAGLVVREREDRDRPGRPRHVYRAGDGAPPEPAEPGYRFLADVLASHLAATADDPAAAAEESGLAWGRYLVERPEPFERISSEQALDRLTELLREFGFDPERDDADPQHPRIRLRRCPFRDVAEKHPEVVCSIHMGLMRGALAELGTDVEAERLLPFVEPTLCVADLEVPS